MTELMKERNQNGLFPVQVGKQGHLVSREIIQEAIAMRDRISADFAAIYLQFKGVSMDVALNILAMPAHHFAVVHKE